jgi:hypothetical protein
VAPDGAETPPGPSDPILNPFKSTKERTTMSILTFSPVAVNLNAAAVVTGEVEYRPEWMGDLYSPTPEQEAEWLAQVAEREADDERLRNEVMTDFWMAEREAESRDAWDMLSPNELIEARGHHPATRYEV